MNDLRRAAEVALQYFEDAHGLEDAEVAIKEALRQALTPEVPCKTHPDAPHGFDRNASHSADRYVCECEGWEPVDNAYTKLDTTAGVLHKEWVGLTTAEVIRCQEVYYFDTYANIEAKLKEKNSP